MMEKYIEMLGWKKLAVLLFIVGGLMLFIFVVALITDGIFSKNLQTGKAQPITSIQVSPTPFESDWIKHDTKLFEISTPRSWFVDRPNVSEGEALLLQGSGVNLFPRIDINVNPQNKLSLQALSTQITSLNFQSGKTTFLDRNTLKFEKDFDSDYFIEGVKQKRKVKKVIYLFERSDLVYEINFGYYKDSTDEKIINEILSTFRLTRN